MIRKILAGTKKHSPIKNCFYPVFKPFFKEITIKEMLSRIEKARLAKVPITNYGVVITHCHNLLTRALSPLFPRPEEFETLTPNSYNLSERLRESNGNNKGT